MSKFGRRGNYPAGHIAEERLEKMESEDRRKRYLAEREAIKQTPEYKENLALRQKWQELDHTRKEENAAKWTLLEKFMENLVSEMTALFNDLTMKNPNTAPHKIATQVSQNFKLDIAFIEENSKTIELPVKWRGTTQTLLTLFWNKVIKICPVFMVNAPKETFSVAYLPMSMVVGEDRQVLQQHLEEFGLFNDKNFTHNYVRFFPDHIDKLRIDLNDLGPLYSCLKLDYTSFERLSDYDKGVLYRSDGVVAVFKKCPNIFEYLPIEQKLKLKDKAPSTLATYLYNNPEILDSLPTNFFVNGELKYLFSSCPFGKAKLREVLGEHAKRHPALDEYLSAKKVTSCQNKVDAGTTTSL